MQGRTASHNVDYVVYGVLAVALLTTVATTATVVFLLGSESLHFFNEVNIVDFLFGSKWEPLIEPKSFGVLPLVAGTMMVVVGAIAIALPFGLLVSVYLSEYASRKTRAIIKPLLEVLAGIPTVVYGYFALTFITPLLQVVWPETEVFNAASAAIVVGIMILPLVSSLSDDALQSVPSGLREGAYALGANSTEVVSQILLPSCSNRIFAATILAISRAIGETMAVTLAAGATPKLTMNPLESIQTMTSYIVQVSMGDTPAGGVEYLTCFAVAGLLFFMTFAMNTIGSAMLIKKVPR